MHKIKMLIAFTLAEVLLVLSITGVVAAMTVPSLLNKINNHQHVVALKKANSDLSQATLRIMADHGGTVKGLCNDLDHECLRDLYLDNMKSVKSCVNQVGNTCWHEAKKWYQRNGVPLSGYEGGHGSIIFSNGTIANFYNFSKSCTNSTEGVINPIKCGRIRVDVNGFKNPNKVGYDIFDFHILENRLLPRGSVSSSCGDGGWGCAAKVLKENAINY